MPTLVLAIFVTTINLLLDIRGKCVKPAYRYLMIFFLVAGVGYFIDGMKQLKADEIQPDYRYLRSQDNVLIVGKKEEKPKKTKSQLDKELIANCWEKSNYHFDEGCKYLKEAEEVLLLYPDIPEFDKSQLCIVNFIAALNSGTPLNRLYNIILVAVGQYAIALSDKWIEFKNLLNNSKHHFEMEEHYRMIGQYHYDLYFIEKEAEKNKK